MSPKQKRVGGSILLGVAILGAMVPICSVVARAQRGYSDIDSNKDAIGCNREDIDGHEERIDGIRDVVVATHTNVERILERMEREHP